MDPDVESIDLAALAAKLAATFGGSAPEGYVRGRTTLRDAVAAHLGCSALMAENLVETMISRGWLRFDGDPTVASEGGRWVISP
jgi:hypothetical protein